MSNVIYEVKDNIGWITLNRPRKLNAINDAMLGELDTTFSKAEPDLDVKVIVIKGAGRCFSTGEDLSGQDTGEVLPSPGAKLTTKQMLDAERRRSRRWEYIFNIHKPIIAQVHGYCLGAACCLTTVCDMVIASEDAVFGDPSIGVGLLSNMTLLPWLVGMKKARELLITGRNINAGEAEKFGLINKVVPASRLEAEVMRYAQGMSLLPADGLAAAKESINGVMEARGVGEAWRFGNELKLLMQRRSTSPDEFDFFKTVADKGLKAALEARDALLKL